MKYTRIQKNKNQKMQRIITESAPRCPEFRNDNRVFQWTAHVYILHLGSSVLKEITHEISPITTAWGEILNYTRLVVRT